MSKSVEEAVYAHWDTCPVNIEQIIRDAGLKLDKKAPLDPEISGQLKLLENGGFEVSVNKDEHYYRQRFTMAHELGHFYLHRSLVGSGTDDNKIYRSSADGSFYNTAIQQKHESEANMFAAYILMPDKLVASELAKSGYAKPYSQDSIVDFSKKFQVSASAMRIRLEQLGHI